jgi:hypothetical protein
MRHPALHTTSTTPGFTNQPGHPYDTNLSGAKALCQTRTDPELFRRSRRTRNDPEFPRLATLPCAAERPRGGE